MAVRLHLAPSTPERRRAFLRAAEALAALDHPNVVAVHDYGVEDDTRYLVMEHLDGIPLNSLASTGGYRLPAPLLVSLGAQLASGLEAMHEAGVPHGGLGMPRVMLLPDGTVKLTLFDLGDERAGPGDDLRALGGLLFHLASGVPAKSGLRVTADRLIALPAGLRNPYARILNRLMSPDPADQLQQNLHDLRDPGPLSLARSAHTPLRYTLLGPPSVSRGTGHPVATGSPQEQAMLCMLLLRHGRTVTRAELTEGIWGRAAAAPDRSAGLLGTYASRLRNALGPGVLAALPDGYALHTSADFVDVPHCRQLAERAEAERAAGNTEAARAHVGEALGLWRGPALDGVPGPAADTARTRLLRLRLSLCATRAELDLELRRFEQAAADLTGLVQEYPDREDFRRLHALAREGGPPAPGPPRPGSCARSSSSRPTTSPAVPRPGSPSNTRCTRSSTGPPSPPARSTSATTATSCSPSPAPTSCPCWWRSCGGSSRPWPGCRTRRGSG